MKNTGDVKLNLPPLPDGWRWTSKYEARPMQPGKSEWIENILSIVAVRDSDDTTVTEEIWVDRYDDYDHLVRGAQSVVDDMADVVANFDKPTLTVHDALEHVLHVIDNAPVQINPMSPNTVRRYNSLRDIGPEEE